ncbi:hypothetical protein HOI18_03040 [Candidatus Uhrbacteria bacterium]|jgi:hypothetical protein|nr:hypothetical protein [Candidatus Uhrbacteria bacterium]
MSTIQILFEEKMLSISSDLKSTAVFFIEIDKEIESFLCIEQQLELIRRQCEEAYDAIHQLAEKLKNNSIQIELKLQEHPETLLHKLKYHRPIRSEIIALFAYLETMCCLHTAYEHKESNPDTIRVLSMKNIDKFINDFCLSASNCWVSQNPERASKINARDLKFLRNLLTHFFSVTNKIQTIHPKLAINARALEKQLEHKAIFLSPEDIREIIQGTGILLLHKWDTDCKDSKLLGNNDFNERIAHVKKIVDQKGALVIHTDEMKSFIQSN